MGVSPIAVSPALAQVLNSAGEKSDVDFDYLLQTAIRESSLRPDARASSSSAVGLFQFLESTWLQVMKEEGPRLGYQKYADAISVNGDGDYAVRDKGLRREILALREDPQVAADLAAAFTRSNGSYLKDRFGRMPSPGELYIAHFLGPAGAAKLFTAGLDNPDQLAATLFPRQARANPTLFYDGGEARTIKQLYRALVSKHVGASPVVVETPAFATQQLASTPQGRWPGEALPSRVTEMSFTSLYRPGARPAGAEPLVATEALQSLVSGDVSAPIANAFAPMESNEQGFVPLPAPAPLRPAGEVEAMAVPVIEAVASPAGDETPRARVLMSPDTAGRSVFFTQLLGQR